MSSLSGDGISRYSERHGAEFATPKAILFRSLKYGSVSAGSIPSVSNHKRMSTTVHLSSTESCATDTCLSPQFAGSTQSCTADTCLSPQFAGSPQRHAADTCSSPQFAVDTRMRPQFALVSPQLRAASGCSVPKRNVEPLTSAADVTDTLSEATTVEACADNLFTNDGEEACADNLFASDREEACPAENTSFHEPSTSRQRWHFLCL